MDELLEAHDGLLVNKDKLWNIIIQFPNSTLSILSIVLPFVLKVSNNSVKNLMSIDNLAIVFSPILLRDDSPVIDLGKTGTQVDLTVQLILFSEVRRILQFLNSNTSF